MGHCLRALLIKELFGASQALQLFFSELRENRNIELRLMSLGLIDEFVAQEFDNSQLFVPDFFNIHKIRRIGYEPCTFLLQKSGG